MYLIEKVHFIIDVQQFSFQECTAERTCQSRVDVQNQTQIVYLVMTWATMCRSLTELTSTIVHLIYLLFLLEVVAIIF